MPLHKKALQGPLINDFCNMIRIKIHFDACYSLWRLENLISDLAGSPRENVFHFFCEFLNARYRAYIHIYISGSLTLRNYKVMAMNNILK